MRWTANKALEQILRREELHIKNVRGKPYVGNCAGLNIARSATRLGEMEKRLNSQQKIVDELKGKVLKLQIPSEGYKRVRNRFLSTFKRNILKRLVNLDRKVILEGNYTAHLSDVGVDATLYISPGGGYGRPVRKDRNTFKALYGLDPRLASKISK